MASVPSSEWTRTKEATQSPEPDQQDVDEVIHQLQLRPALAHIYPIFIMLNGVIFLLAIPCNSMIIVKALTAKEARKSRLLHFLTNAAICDLFKLIFVLPITLANSLLVNFVFGSVLCYALPMLLVFPIHASIFTYVGLTYDRFRRIRYPDQRYIPTIFFLAASWILAFCAVIPYTSFIIYIDLGALRGELYQNMGFCFIQSQRNIQGANFLFLFLAPSSVMMFLLMRTTSEINFQRKELAGTCICDEDCVMYVNNRPAASLTLDLESEGSTGNSGRKGQSLVHEMSGGQDPEDVYRLAYGSKRQRVNSDSSIMGVNCAFCTSEIQMRDHRRITIIITLFILCWTPINIFNLAIHFLPDSPNNDLLGLDTPSDSSQRTHYLDLINLVLSWLGFASTCFNPFIMYAILKDRVTVHKTCHGKDTTTSHQHTSGHSRSKSTSKSNGHTTSGRRASPAIVRKTSYTPSDSYNPIGSRL